MSLILIVESVGFGVRAESVVDGFDPERPSQQATAVDGVDAQRTSSVKLATSGWDSLRSASQSASRTATSKSVVDGVDVGIANPLKSQNAFNPDPLQSQQSSMALIRKDPEITRLHPYRSPDWELSWW